MARKGFYSFDRVIASTLEEDSQESNQIHYVLIACPRHPSNNRLSNLEGVPEIRYKAKMINEYLNSSPQHYFSLRLLNHLWYKTRLENTLFSLDDK